jgi:hypothetical protein
MTPAALVIGGGTSAHWRISLTHYDIAIYHKDKQIMMHADSGRTMKKGGK